MFPDTNQIDPMMAAEQQPMQSGLPVEPQYEEIEERSSLAKFIDSVNIADDLDDDMLKAIGNRCFEGYDVDENSRKEWLQQVESAIELANQATQEKSFPWNGAANIKLPTILDACIKFAARASSELIKDDKVVKVSVLGDDPNEEKAQRAERVGTYMSWQLTEQEIEWEPDTDKLLHMLPLVGHMFRKRYYCSNEKRVKSELCMPKNVCVNKEAKSLESCRRFTHIIENVDRNTIVGNQRAGVFRKIEITSESGTEATEQRDLLDSQDYYTLLEQYCWLDLDDDGFEEPYIVTVEKNTKQVLRIVARYDDEGVTENDKGEVMGVKAKCYFTDYVFIPSLDGSYYGVGFGQMLEPLVRVANTLVNQIADSGALNNMQAGYLSREVKLKSGREKFELGEWKRTTASAEELRNGVFPLPTKEPSPTLFNLLGMILDLTQDLSSVKDVMNGDAPGNNVPATTVVALIEQGMKTFNAIYKRIYRSMRKEFKQLFELNYDYLDEQEYFDVLDSQITVGKGDFESGSFDVRPIADPTMSSDMQRLARSEALGAMVGMPGVNPKPILEQRLDALKIPKSLQAEILPEQDPNGVPPHVQAMMQEAESKMADIQLKEQELELKAREVNIKEFVAQVNSLKTMAEAEAIEPGQQLQMYKQFADHTFKMLSLDAKNQQQAKGGTNEVQPNQARGMGSMEEQPGNPQISGIPPM